MFAFRELKSTYMINILTSFPSMLILFANFGKLTIFTKIIL